MRIRPSGTSTKGRGGSRLSRHRDRSSCRKKERGLSLDLLPLQSSGELHSPGLYFLYIIDKGFSIEKLFLRVTLWGMILTVTKLDYFAFAYNLAGAAGHTSLVRKLTSLRRFDSHERRAGVFLVESRTKKAPEGALFCTRDSTGNRTPITRMKTWRPNR